MKIAFYGLAMLILLVCIAGNFEVLSVNAQKDSTQWITRGRFKIPTPREYIAYQTAKVFGSEHLIAMNNLVTKESNYDPTIRNKTSGAAGIPQAYPREKMKCKLSWEWNDYRCQADWLVAYIKQRYGDPTNAWNYHLENNSY